MEIVVFGGDTRPLDKGKVVKYEDLAYKTKDLMAKYLHDACMILQWDWFSVRKFMEEKLSCKKVPEKFYLSGQRCVG